VDRGGALLLVLTGGTAYVLDGSNTVFSGDIINGAAREPPTGCGGSRTKPGNRKRIPTGSVC